MTEVSAKRTKRASTINYDAGTIVFNGETYGIKSLPEKEAAALALHGLRSFLLASDDAAKDFGTLSVGATSLIKAKAAPKIDAWRDAAATVHARGVAEQKLQAAGFKAPVGKRLTDTAEYKVEFEEAFEDARTAAGKWSRGQLAKVKTNPAVVAEHNRLAAADASLHALFSAA